jgi:hypothetical protein
MSALHGAIAAEQVFDKLAAEGRMRSAKPDDPTPPVRVEATAEPTPGTSEPSGATRSPTGRRRGLSRPSALVGWLLLAIAGFGMFISTPQGAGSDEPAHELTAWYLSAHGLPPTSDGEFSVPVSFTYDPCFNNSTINASCASPRSTDMVLVPNSRVLLYPPPYYWVVGAGQRLAASLVGVEYADIGGRLASFILNFGTLFLLSLYMRRRNQVWGTILLIVATPMAAFMWSVVNPNGWEITCGLVMAAALSEAAWSHRWLETVALPKSTTLLLVVASIALSLARPLGFVWAAGLTLSAFTLAPSINRRLLVRVACAVAPGIILGLLWTLGHHALIGPPGTEPSPTTVGDLITWFAASLARLPLHLWQMFGVLGYTPAPLLLFAANVFAWGALLRRLPAMRKAAAICGVFGIVILPSVIESAGWAVWPAWWQGRYTLPFALGFALLWLLRSGQLIPRAISVMSGIGLLSLGLMVWINALRYAFGVDLLGVPVSLAQQGISPVRLWLSMAVATLLFLVSIYLLVQTRRMKPDLRPSIEPETRPTPPPPISAV